MEELVIDKEIRRIIPVLTSSQKERLKKQLANGLVPSVIVSGNKICYGLNEYELCKEYGFDYNVDFRFFLNKDELIEWLCDKVLTEYKPLFEQNKKYCIGKIFNVLKKGAVKYKPGTNQNTMHKVKKSYRQLTEEIGKKYYMSYSTVEKYGRYTESLDNLDKLVPTFVDKILSGDIKLSHENLEKLSKSSKLTIERITQSLIHDIERKQTLKDNKRAKYAIHNIEEIEPVVQIKNQPEYDPDVEVNTLFYTVPNWKQSIERVLTTNVGEASLKARERLIGSLNDLINTCNYLLESLRDE